MDIVSVKSQIDILRRVAERGLSYAISFDDPDSGFVDLFQHILDEIAVLKVYIQD
jgi:hypothetical protein